MAARVLFLVLLAAALAGCGGSSERSAEQEDFILELEVPLVGELDEPDVYGQAGLSAESNEKTHVVVDLDDPHKGKYRAEIRRGGCGSFRSMSADYELGEVKDGRLETSVEVRLRDIREGGYVLVVKEPQKDKKEDPSSDRFRFGAPDKGTCGELASAEPTEG